MLSESEEVRECDVEGLAECDLLVQAVDVEESPVASYAQLEELIFVGNVFLWSLISNAPSSAMASKSNQADRESGDDND